MPPPLVNALLFDQLHYFATGYKGGGVSFASATNANNLTNDTNENNAALFENPAGSRVLVHIDTVNKSVTAQGAIRRYRGPTISSRGTARTETNLGGFSNSAASKLYAPAQFGTSANGTLSRAFLVNGFAPVNDHWDGALMLQPGQAILYTYQQVAAGGSAPQVTFEVVWWETPSA